MVLIHITPLVSNQSGLPQQFKADMKTGKQRKQKRKPDPVFRSMFLHYREAVLKTYASKLFAGKSKHTKRKIKRGWISPRKEMGSRVSWDSWAQEYRGEWDGKGQTD